MLRRIIGFWIIVFVMFFVVTQPATAADFGNDWDHGVHDIGCLPKAPAEERLLAAKFPSDYERYRRRVSMLVPRPRRSRA